VNSTAQKIREFPALLMTVLFVGAALASTGCLRKMHDPALPMPSYRYGDVEYFTPGADAGPAANAGPPAKAGPAANAQLARQPQAQQQTQHR